MGFAQTVKVTVPGFCASLVVASLGLAACEVDSLPPNVATAETAAANPVSTAVFDCESNGPQLTFTVRTMDQQLALWLPARFTKPYLVLQPVRAASGARYASDDVMVWLHGDEAMLDVAGESFKGCRRNTYASIWEHAKLDGVDFRATGNEPGWVLEIRNRRSVLLNYDYGESIIRVQAAEPVDNQEKKQTTIIADVDGQALTVEISALRCRDSMSDTEFESTVVVYVGDRVLHGCGRALH